MATTSQNLCALTRRDDVGNLSNLCRCLNVKDTQPATKSLLNHEDARKGGFFFEVGAFNGEELSNTLFHERELGWTGALMEPSPSYLALKSKNRRAHIMRACVAPDTTYSELDLDVGKIYAEMYSLVNAKKAQKSARVPCYPFYSVLTALGNPVVDFMTLDVEGVEMKVLRSIPWNDVKIRVITVEIIWAPEGPEGIRKFMEARGFEFIEKLDYHYLFFDKKLSHGLNRKVKV
ncbi:protein Star-like [Hyalella azteca]|uniref:Protein Star-like n=1 Tax=Hyalella azteca TaxID=294128 RepID=A0A8B7NCQ3_HYAAZ|nr:protein Star-like [Hyalella azteca]